MRLAQERLLKFSFFLPPHSSSATFFLFLLTLVGEGCHDSDVGPVMKLFLCVVIKSSVRMFA
jgi:hypothetical protein